MYIGAIYNEMLDNNVIRVGQPLFFKYTTDKGEDLIFDATVQKEGIEVNGQLHTPSSASSLCLYNNTNDRMAVNGWLAWTNDEGLSLSQLYLRYKGKPYKHLQVKKLVRHSSHHSLSRDVVFFFGAGISMADGAPSQAQILSRMYQQNKQTESYKNHLNEIMAFLKKAFDYDQESTSTPSLEYIFGFIDFFLTLNQSYTKYYTTNKLIEIREDLIRFINHFIHEKINPESGDMSKLISKIKDINTNVSVITLNYDTLFEDSFSKYIVDNLYISFCYDLVNYRYQYLTPDSWLINPDEAMLLPDKSEPKTIKFLKLHGSLNWFYCNVCNSLMIKPRYHKRVTSLNTDCAEMDKDTTKLLCPQDGSRMLSLTTPPAYKKDLTHPVISNLLIEASNEISAAKKIVFIGYSMPEADVHIKAILSRAGTHGKKLVVINPFMDDNTKHRYQQLNKNIEFIEKTFTDVLNDGDMDTILKSD